MTEAGAVTETKTDAAQPGQTDAAQPGQTDAAQPGQTDAAEPEQTDAVAESTEVGQNGSDAVNGSEQPEENATTSDATGKYLCVALFALCTQQLVL